MASRDGKGFHYLTVLGSALAVFQALPAAADPVADFYRGKTISLYIGFTQGGGYDVYARAVARFMAKHIPGNPTIVPRQMPGVGSLLAANNVYNIAPKDGTVLATIDQAAPVNEFVGDQAVRFRSDKFSWIGNSNADVNVMLTWHGTGLTSLDMAKGREVTMGATAPAPNTSALYPRLTNTMLGTRFKIITGYPGGADIDLAMERGELDGRGSNAWATLKATRPDWVRERKVNVLAQIGLKRAKDLPDVPLLTELVKSDNDRALVHLLSATTSIGRPLFSTPDVPADRVAALRQAFDATMKDPEFQEAAAKARLDINPISGAELQTIVGEILATPKSVATRLSAIIAGRE
jgi:tripartite-type tricarboxylate transporter receptor subunit TctC